MKEELLRVLNVKLDDINANIDSLEELNNRIDGEEQKLSYVRKILNLFKKDDNYSVLNFANIGKEDFLKVLDELGEDTRKVFNTNSCNYDGLVYLINGINSGVSLTLTDEQEKGIESLIRGLDDKEMDYEASIDGLQLVKERFPISDISLLNKEKDAYSDIVYQLNSERYVSETDRICEAIKYSKINDEDTIKILSYLLEYNADVYKKGDNHEVASQEKQEFKEEPVYVDVKTDTDNNVGYEEFHFEEFNAPSFDTIKNEEVQEEKTPLSVTIEEEASEDVPVAESSEEVTEFKPIVEEYNEPPKVDHEIPVVDNDFDGVVSSSDDYEEDKISKQDLQKLLKEYGLKDEKDNRLLEGNGTNYREVLDTLKETNLLDEVVKNHELFVLMLLHSSRNKINKVLDIARNDLSIDKDDYDETKKIIVNTLPIIFTKGYDDFVENVLFFKELDVNLVNLFDFSKEVLIVDNDDIVRNYNIISKYNIKIDYKNAKYFLMLDNIEEKVDYYVESIYPDKTKKNELFDGLKYVTSHSAKLNTVSDLTIKRLRFASENGKKVFGTKPNSLNGEITNLKVNSLEINDEYLKKYFDNHFTNINNEEVKTYIKYLHDDKNIDDYTEELRALDKYREDLRYHINNINVSYNKVLRNYNILRSHDVSKKKALEFAVCHNLVITHDEYEKLMSVLNEIGGND